MPHTQAEIDPWPARLSLFYGLIACVMLSVAMPPFQNPDEVNHFLRAEQVSRGGLLAERRGDTLGGLVSPGVQATADVYDSLRFHPERQVTPDMAGRAATIGWDSPPVRLHFPNSAIYPAPFYGPAAIGVLLGKALSLSVASTLVLSRMLTGLACVLIASWSIGLVAASTRRSALYWLFALATLPMMLALENAGSQDGLMFSSMLLAVALFLRLDGGGRDAIRFWSATLLLALIAMARPPYAPLCLVPLAMPYQGLARRVAGCGVVVALCLIWTQIADPAHVITGRPGANVLEQRHVLMDPIWDVKLVLRTLRAHGTFYAASFVGIFGWLDTVMPRLFYVVASLVLAGAAWIGVGSGGTARLWRRETLVLAAVGGCVGLVFLSIYLTWSDVRSPTIDGVQGRYFIPMAMLLACLAPVRVARMPTARAWRGLRRVIIWFPTASLVVSFMVIMRRYHGWG